MRLPKRPLAITLPSALVLATAVACGSAAGMGQGPAPATGSGTGSGMPSGTVALKVTGNPSLGQIVTNANGKTVYRYDLDRANSGTSACTGSCASVWPAVTVAGSTVPEVSGVNPSQVGEITRADGAKQLTLAGSPLYTYRGDAKAGSVSGQGFSGIWWAVTPAGAKAMPHTGTAPSYGGNGGY